MQSFQELLLLIFHTGKTPLSKETCVLEPCCSQSKEWQSLLVKLMLSLLFALQNLSSFLKVSGTWECEVGACSCLTWSHENTLSGKRTFQALRLPRVVRNVVCGFWIFTIHWKESALKQLVPWLLEGQAYICMLGMSPVKFQLSLFSYYFFKDAEHRSYLSTSQVCKREPSQGVLDSYGCSIITHLSFFGFCILLLSLSLHCKRCTKQMLDKDLEVIEWLTISGVKSNQLWQCPDFLCDTKSLGCKIPFSDPTLVLVASFGKSLIVAEALIGIWELGGRWVGAPYSSDFHKRENGWLQICPSISAEASLRMVAQADWRLIVGFFFFLFWRRFFLP